MYTLSYILYGGEKQVYHITVKIHEQVHSTIALQFYVHIKVELYVHAFTYLYAAETGMLNYF